MVAQIKDAESSYSPEITIELVTQGQIFDVASFGFGKMIVRNARSLEAGTALVRLRVANELAVYHIELPQGIDPARVIQPFALISVNTEVAA